METHRKTNGWQGTVLADTYRVLQRLGKGGMGEVYEAEHLRVGKRVAVKVMHGDAVGDRRAIERFRREVRALSAITSEHVVSVLDCGELDGETPYVVMERLQGEDLRHLLAREGPLSVYRAIRFALDACAGLADVHDAGLVHRDLKPANLFITRSRTRGELCKILDFGVAKRQASEATSQGGLLGTVRYMAPEQLSDSASVAITTDVYAVGAILFECLTGRPAHDADSPEELMFDILNRDPPLATELRSEVPEDLAETIRCAMSRLPSERFQNVVELAEALERFLPERDSDQTARDQSGVSRPPPRFRRPFAGRRAKVAASAGLVGGVLVGLLLSHLGAGDVPNAASLPSLPIAQAAGIEPRSTPSSAPLPVPSSEGPILAAAPAEDAATRNDLPSKNASERRRVAPPARSAGDRTPTSAPAAVVLDVKNPYD